MSSQIILISYNCAGQRRHITQICPAGGDPVDCVEAAAGALADALADCNEGQSGDLPTPPGGDIDTFWVNGGGKKVRVESSAASGESRQDLDDNHEALVDAAQDEWPEGPSGA